MKKILFLLLTISCVFKVFSQDDISVLKGAVFNDTISVEGITVTNKNLKQSIATNHLGVFEIPVRLGDSIVISAIHVNRKSLYVTQEIINRGEIGIEVSSAINQMDELILNSIISKSALNFSAALKKSKSPDFYSLKKNEIAALANTDPTKRYGVGGDVNWLSGVTKLFSDKKKKKSLNRIEKLQKWDRFKSEFLSDYGTTFFTDQLKISEMILDEFLIYCRGKKDIASMYFNHQELELIDFFVKQSEIYKEKYNIE